MKAFARDLVALTKPRIIELLLITSNDHIAHIAHLGGALFAWFYLRWEGRGGNSLMDNFNHWQTRRRWEKARRESEKMQAVMEDIDVQLTTELRAADLDALPLHAVASTNF